MNKILANLVHRPSVTWPTNQSRSMFEWLTIVFNNVDQKKIQEMGPDRAAAEWLIRNGAGVRWAKFSAGGDEYFFDYKQLVSDPTLADDHLVAFDATKSSIHPVGFPYLKNLKHLQTIIFRENPYIGNKALRLLAEYQLPLLRHLEVISCYDVSDPGVLQLKNLKTLNFLKLENLLSVEDRAQCLAELRQSLPGAKIEWNK